MLFNALADLHNRKLLSDLSVETLLSKWLWVQVFHSTTSEHIANMIRSKTLSQKSVQIPKLRLKKSRIGVKAELVEKQCKASRSTDAKSASLKFLMITTYALLINHRDYALDGSINKIGWENISRLPWRCELKEIFQRKQQKSYLNIFLSLTRSRMNETNRNYNIQTTHCCDKARPSPATFPLLLLFKGLRIQIISECANIWKAFFILFDTFAQ